MNWEEHNPPHFHVKYAEYNAMILIAEGIVAKGFLPAKQLKLVLAWAEIHKDELMQNWELSKIKEPLNKIAPLM